MPDIKQPMVGSTSANFHEGSRSEYLAQYIFASFGTAVPVPHQEDTGLDLYCTLTERVGQRIWPRAYFSVQVKSNISSWKFNGEESVRWIVEHPLPIFLCVVDKFKSSVQIYHTCPRFYVWSLPPLPESLELVPGDRGVGESVQWRGSNSFSLSAPIVALTLNDMMNEAIMENVKAVLHSWIDVEMDNLNRVRAGVLEFIMPAKYETNVKGYGGTVFQGINYAKPEDIRQSISQFEIPLGWITDQLFKDNDIDGAVRGALLHRYLFKDRLHDRLTSMNHNLGQKLAKTVYNYQAIDEISANLDKELARMKEPNPE